MRKNIIIFKEVTVVFFLSFKKVRKSFIFYFYFEFQAEL